ncbi:hypothetical protein Bca52824_006411 [Brassica carinata]|uniref:Replication factor A C-terminal domain-containing protein n=1 Tax=Brassica carinata TaxID=52824 RepID=A0A8X7W7Z3_BRACI|nr:hypothetical protein Bca52824_006411 [Brassica carinata]
MCSLPNDSLALTNNDSSQWSVGSATSVRARFFVTNERLTIREIIDSDQAGQYVVVATIEAVDLEKSWYYTACNLCNRKVVSKGDGFDAIDNHVELNPRYNSMACKKDVEHVIHCYYLVLRVSDESKAKAKFLLFNNAAQKLIRRPAFELVQEAAERERVARKEILDNRRTIGLTTSNRGTHTETQSSPSSANLSGSGNGPHPAINRIGRIGNQEGIQRSTTISARKRKTLGSPPLVNSKTRQTKARQGSNMTGQSNPTLPILFVTDANPEAIKSPFQQTETNQFVPPPRFIVENHPEAYNNRYEMESESETENEDDENQTYTNYPAGVSLITPSPQHIPQQKNHTKIY